LAADASFSAILLLVRDSRIDPLIAVQRYVVAGLTNLSP